MSMPSVKNLICTTPLLCGLVSILALGCKPSQKSDEAKATQPDKPVVVKPVKPELTKLDIKDTVVGKGPAVKVGDTLYMMYKGTFTDGSVFDTNIKEGGQPFSLTLGAGQVIKGWDQGLVGMKAGGKRTLGVPWNLAYGAEGRNTIPPKTDLYFDVELLAAIKKGEEDLVSREDVKLGTGPAVKAGNTVSVNYVGTLVNGQEFDSTKKSGKPFSFKVQATPPEVIPGFDSGVVGMKKGGVRKLIIPPLVGYGMRPSGGIPPNSILRFEIELVGVK